LAGKIGAGSERVLTVCDSGVTAVESTSIWWAS
jgi:hypothetical protein